MRLDLIARECRSRIVDRGFERAAAQFAAKIAVRL
jgi:hypothetical protein